MHTYVVLLVAIVEVLLYTPAAPVTYTSTTMDYGAVMLRGNILWDYMSLSILSLGVVLRILNFVSSSIRHSTSSKT